MVVGRFLNCPSETRWRKMTMNALIDTILSVENEANQLLEKARAEAKALEKKAAADIAALQQEMADKVVQKVAAFRETAERRHAEAAANEEQAGKQAVAALDTIPEAAISKQVNMIVARFCEI